MSPESMFSDYYAHKAMTDQAIEDSKARMAQNNRHYAQMEDQSQRHHDEMMKLMQEHKDLVDGYKDTRNELDRRIAEYQTLVSIVKEHLPEMSISKEQINSRLDGARASAEVSYPDRSHIGPERR